MPSDRPGLDALRTTTFSSRARVSLKGLRRVVRARHSKTARRDAGPFLLANIGRDDWIRTSDPLTPSQVRYQAALHPE